MFLCEFWKFLKNTYFAEHLQSDACDCFPVINSYEESVTVYLYTDIQI